jgi:formate hydrogenlyase subunit 3/multisubunit Na+/H+ antiporter MnhD subunit
LVSPSVLNYLVHHQYFHYAAPAQKVISKLKATFYMLGIKEWNLDTIMFTYLWSPFKWLGRQVHFLQSNLMIGTLSVTGITILLFGSVNHNSIPSLGGVMPIVLMSIALAVILFSFAYRGSAIKAWTYLITAHLFIVSSVLLNASHINSVEIIFYVSGVTLAFILGYYCLRKIKAIDNSISLNQYHGYVYEQNTTGFLFLVASMGMLGFPVTAAFVGIDVLFTYVLSDQVFLIILMALCFLFIELTAFRILLRIFLGPHKKLYHTVAFRSS